MATIGKSAYFISASVGAHRHMLYQIEYLMDRGAQPSLVAELFLPVHWAIHRQAAANVHLRSAYKDLIEFIGKIDLHVRIGESLAQTTFHIVKKLAVNILFRGSFSDENILGILPQSKKVVPCNCNIVSILAPKITDADVNVIMGNASEATPKRVAAIKRMLNCMYPNKPG